MQNRAIKPSAPALSGGHLSGELTSPSEGFLFHSFISAPFSSFPIFSSISLFTLISETSKTHDLILTVKTVRGVLSSLDR